jgi:hypothetical protein
MISVVLVVLTVAGLVCLLLYRATRWVFYKDDVVYEVVIRPRDSNIYPWEWEISRTLMVVEPPGDRRGPNPARWSNAGTSKWRWSARNSAKYAVFRDRHRRRKWARRGRVEERFSV